MVMHSDPDAPRRGVTAHRYIEVLKEHLPAILDYNSIFMQNNAPIHKAHAVQAWFRDMAIELVNWPPYSPDLNPIKNLQKMLKAKIIKFHPELVTIKDNNTTQAYLILCAQKAWDLLKEEILDKLASGMQKRVDAIKAAGGWYIKY